MVLKNMDVSQRARFGGVAEGLQSSYDLSVQVFVLLAPDGIQAAHRLDALYPYRIAPTPV